MFSTGSALAGACSMWLASSARPSVDWGSASASASVGADGVLRRRTRRPVASAVSRSGFGVLVLVLVGLFFFGAQQGFAVGDRDLVVVGMDFGEGEEAVAVAAVLDEGRLERGLYAGDLGEVDVAPELPPRGGLEVEFLKPVTVSDDNPCLFRVDGIHQ